MRRVPLVAHLALATALPMGKGWPILADAVVPPRAAAAGAAAQQPPFLLITYHKTGHYAVHQLLEEFAKQGSLLVDRAHDGILRRTSCETLQRAPHFVRDTPAVVAAPSFFCAADGDLPPNVRVAHVMREPVDMAISAYLYHKQTTPPEVWLSRSWAIEGPEPGDKAARDSPCAVDAPTLRRMAAAAGIDPLQVEAAAAECERLLAKSGAETYHAALNALPRDEGLRLEAARFLVSRGTEAGADLLRMPANANYLDDHLDEPAYCVLEPSWFDPTKRRAAIEEIARHMYPLSTPAELLTSHVDAVDAAFQKSQQDYSAAADKQAHHITRDSITAEERAAMMAVLEEDPVLGPVLLASRAVVLAHCEDHPE